MKPIVLGGYLYVDMKSQSQQSYEPYTFHGFELRVGESMWINFCLTANVHTTLSVGVVDMHCTRNLDMCVCVSLCQRLAMGP